MFILLSHLVSIVYIIKIAGKEWMTDEIIILVYVKKINCLYWCNLVIQRGPKRFNGV